MDQQSIIRIKSHLTKRNNSQIAYEYKIQDQVSLQIPGIFEKLSTAFIAWYNQNRKGIVSE
jgi:hypothetical protein